MTAFRQIEANRRECVQLGAKVSEATNSSSRCAADHHREAHRSGDEASWWSNAGIDPTGAARTLWTNTHPVQSFAEAPNLD